MTKEELQNITELFEEAETALSKYNEEDTYDTLYNIANTLMDSDDDELVSIGESLDYELSDEYITEDQLEDYAIQQRLDNTGAQGVACMLSQYDGHYEVHVINAYGNINDEDLFSDLKTTFEDYKEQFEEVAK